MVWGTTKEMGGVLITSSVKRGQYGMSFVLTLHVCHVKNLARQWSPGKTSQMEIWPKTQWLLNQILANGKDTLHMELRSG